MRRGVPVACAVVLTALSVPVPAADADPADAVRTCPWVASTASVEDRVTQVLAHMTLDDKLHMVHGSAGPFGFVGPEYAGVVPAIPRLCVPRLGLSDGPAGVGNDNTGVTQLPAPIALGASWDPALAASYGDVVAREVKGKGAAVSLSPTVDPVRDPRAGRGYETFGEDPELTGTLAASEIGAIQSNGVLAQAKHLAAYTQETFRNTRAGNAVVDERTLQELYLPAFADAVDAGVASVMCAYNSVNGTRACDNSYLLDRVLKGQFGFDGFVTSDWFATHSGPATANAGTDMQMPGGCQFGPMLRHAVRTGAVPSARLDDMVGRILRPMFRLGLFDRPETGSPDAVVTTPRHATVAREVAEQGTVLLKNDHDVLPLAGRGSVAVIGEAAGSEAIGSGGGSAHVVADAITTPFDGIAARARQAGADVRFDDGSHAADAAAGADTAVVVVSRLSAESKDHKNIELSDRDNRMIADAAAANPNTVVVLNTGGPVAMPWVRDVAGVLAAWYPGQEYGDALAALLFGDVNPSGKLPVTFPASLDQVPARDWSRFPGGRHDEGLAIGYRWYDSQGIEPLFPFGHGLSYTSYRYSALGIEPGADGAVRVSADVTNTGRRRGAEAVQVYLTHPERDGEPPRKLAGFAKVALDPGETRRVTVPVDVRSFSHWDTGRHRWLRSAGRYVLSVGGSSRDLPLAGSVRVERTEPTSEPTPPATPGAGGGLGGQLRSTVACPTEAVFSGALGAATLTGLPPARQAVVPPRDPTG